MTANDEDSEPMMKARKYSGVENSQVEATNVIGISFGNAPMMMEFSFLDPTKELEQSRDEDYIVIPCYSFPCAEGYISVLDPMDDLLVCHGVRFVDLRLERVITSMETIWEDIPEKLRWRGVIMIRWLSNVQEFYTDTSTMKLDSEMLICWKKVQQWVRETN